MTKSYISHSRIQEIYNFEAIKLLIPKLSQKTLVIFDIDDVLIMPTEQYNLTHPYRKEIVEQAYKTIPYEELVLAYSIILKHQTIRLVDDNIIQILADLENYRISTIALTKRTTGKFGCIPQAEDILFDHLRAVGIDFTDLTPFKEEILLKEMGTEKNGVPILKNGVIMTANLDKGKVLKEVFSKVFDNVDFFPEKIIFFDDQEENVFSVSNLCKSLGIEFHGFLYLGASLVPVPELNEQFERLRFEELFLNSKWLTDEELTKSYVVLSKNTVNKVSGAEPEIESQSESQPENRLIAEALGDSLNQYSDHDINISSLLLGNLDNENLDHETD